MTRLAPPPPRLAQAERRHAWLIAALAHAVVLALMLVPMPRSGGPPSIPHLDKLVHLAAWALLALASWPLVRALLAHRLGPTARAVLIVTLLGLWGVVIELVQGLTPHRSADPWDALADTLGAALGAVLGLWRERRPGPSPQPPLRPEPPHDDPR